MSALQKATGWIAQFMSALTGMSLSSARSGARGLYEQVQAMNDTSKAAIKQVMLSRNNNKNKLKRFNVQINRSHKLIVKVQLQSLLKTKKSKLPTSRLKKLLKKQRKLMKSCKDL